MTEKLKIMFCASEVTPFAKTGGLADVASALPKAIKKMGHEIAVVMPKYEVIDKEKFNLIDTGIKIEISINKINYIGNVLKGTLLNSDVTIYFIEEDFLYKRNGIYYNEKEGKDYPDNILRYVFFNLGVIELCKKLNFKPDIIHCNDWHASLIPVYLKTLFKDDPYFKETKTALTIHNLGYQGIFQEKDLNFIGISKNDAMSLGLFHNDSINLFKAGILNSNIITAVSKTYAQEIKTKEFGFGLEEIMQKRADSTFGILNGVDYTEWSPEIDNLIIKKYSVNDISGKKECKKELQRICNLPQTDSPLIGIITRLADQKGLDIIAEIIEEILQLDIQFVLLGTGDPKYHELFGDIGKKYPGKASINLKFDNKLSHQIEAGADIFLMPSQYEPCGLNQIYSLKYGTIPVVRKTGGLADTIKDFNAENNTGNGFVFDSSSGSHLFNVIKNSGAYTQGLKEMSYPAALLYKTIKRGVDFYNNKEVWENLIKRAMIEDFSWEKSAQEYIEVYKKA